MQILSSGKEDFENRRWRKTLEHGMIFNIQRYSTEDGPGIRTTVFMKGCPLRCPWCQNPEGLDTQPNLVWYQSRCIGALNCMEVCPVDALKLEKEGMNINRKKCTKCGDCVEACPAGALELIGRRFREEELLEKILRDKPFYDKSDGGVTFGGGEPLLQADFLRKILPKLKEENTHVAIDTSGAVSWKNFEKIIEWVDLFLYDLKTLDEEKFKEYTGGNLNLVLENLLQISNYEVSLWIRTPVIPKYTNSKENITEISSFIAKNLPNVEKYELLAFNNLCGSDYKRVGMEWELEGVPLMEEGEMEELKEIVMETGNRNVEWSGPTRMENK